MIATSPTRSDMKRQQILDAAMTLFCVQGFTQTSMIEVAKHADVSKQTVYAHFGSKDELFVAAIAAKCAMHQISDSLLSDVHQVEKCIQGFSQAFAGMIITPEAIAVFKACVAQSDSHPEVSALFYDAGPKHVVGLLSQYLQQVKALGYYDFGDCHHAAVRLCLMLFGEQKMQMELGLAISDTAEQRQCYVSQTAQMFLRAYRVN
ncbi:TetR/AcrR family transcriptional regulator [Shewanella sp. NIFS-20-20]|uniref:TetR/AcrR family transcriptional regulator n=1 Tax=Shewanella sp. NIFS-20-20 TaxID=2853806 RepID=UPI001C448F48|nr:TetR/AcrR family transcriptional regulator [Shewanella sp. NIFS-20-20]MBV7316401.1 TetR/AcrR family transcriptional regulator [Shewanella sp. NIFS-20-20]